MATTKAHRRSALRDRQRNFYFALVATALGSLVLLTLGVNYKLAIAAQTILPPAEQRFFFGFATESVAAECLIALGTTALATAGIGFIVDYQQRRYSEEISGYDRNLRQQGILTIYRSSEDHEFIEALEGAISEATSEIRGLGLGLSVLLNHTIFSSIAEQIQKEKNLAATFILGSAANAGVMNRLEEEAGWYEERKTPYDRLWAAEFPVKIRGAIEMLVAQPSARDRLGVLSAKTCPMVGYLRADKRAFLFMYGHASMKGGSESPWIELDLRQREGHLVKFVERLESRYSDETSLSFLPPAAASALQPPQSAPPSSAGPSDGGRSSQEIGPM